MLIVCPSCASEYTIDPAKLGAEGRTLRCAICRDTWFVAPPGAEAAAPEEPAEPPPEPPGATLLPPAPPKPRRSRTAPRRWLAAAAAAVVLLVALPYAGSGLQKGRSLAENWIAPPTAILSFREVASEIAGPDDARILHVTGEIANAGTGEAALSPLEFLVRNGDEQVLATWTEAPPKPNLAPGETVRFTARLASPPMDGRQVRVHFARGGVAVASR
jgi:predicted Zn finger-like uncharacterized protein